MTFGSAQNGPRLLSVDGIVVQNKLGGGEAWEMVVMEEIAAKRRG